MTNADYCHRLRELLYTAGMNQRYHHCLEWRYGTADKAIRILVGILAITGAILAVPQLDCPWIGFWVALVSAVAAAVLNIVPVGDREKFHGAMYQHWGDLRKDARSEEHRFCDAEGEPGAHRVERLHELLGKMESLNLMEPAPWRGLLVKCQEDENESEWGKGIRTPKQITSERGKREGATLSASASPSGADRG